MYNLILLFGANCFLLLQIKEGYFVNELTTTSQALIPVADQEENWQRLQLMLKYSKWQIWFAVCLLLNSIAFTTCLVYWIDFNTAQIFSSFSITLAIWLAFAITANVYENKYTDLLDELGIVLWERKAFAKVNQKITVCAFLLGFFAWIPTIKLLIWTKILCKDAMNHFLKNQTYFIKIEEEPDEDVFTW